LESFFEEETFCILYLNFNLGVNADDLAALVAVVGEDVLVALDAVGVIVPQNVAVSGEGVVAVVAEHLLFVEGLFAA